MKICISELQWLYNIKFIHNLGYRYAEIGCGTLSIHLSKLMSFTLKVKKQLSVIGRVTFNLNIFTIEYIRLVLLCLLFICYIRCFRLHQVAEFYDILLCFLSIVNLASRSYSSLQSVTMYKKCNPNIIFPLYLCFINRGI